MATHGLPGVRNAYAPAFFSYFARATVAACVLCALLGPPAFAADESMRLRVTDRRTGTLYADMPVRVNSRLFFGWIHSLEQIPWNEYYHVDAQGRLILDAITFPAFGAGIPEDKGRVCYVRDGLIHMEEIGQIFPELVWLNSHSATRDIVLDGVRVARGADLPHHAQLRLRIDLSR